MVAPTTSAAGVAFLAVSLMTACGDPRQEFLGAYKGPQTWTEHYSDGTSASSALGEKQVTISAPADSDVLLLGTSCAFTASVVAAHRFSFNKKACPSKRVRLGPPTQPFDCDLSQSVVEGFGTLDRSTVTMDFSGDIQMTGCSGGNPSRSFGYSSQMIVTR